MTTTTESWSDVLDVLDNGRNWCKSSYTSDDYQSFCVLGAFGLAWSTDPAAAENYYWQSAHEDALRSLAALMPVTDIFIDPTTSSLTDLVVHITKYNDRRSTSWFDIENILNILATDSETVDSELQDLITVKLRDTIPV